MMCYITQNIDKTCFFLYNTAMEQINKTKLDGFVGEKMIVMPKEIISKYVNNVFVNRLYITDVGYFPEAKGHHINRPNGVEEFIFFYCISGKGVVNIREHSFSLHKNTAICIPKKAAHSYYTFDDDPWTILWAHFDGTDTAFYPLSQTDVIHFRSEYSSNRMLFLFNQLFRVIESNYSTGNFIYISQTLQMILSETYYKDELSSDQNQNNNYLNAIIKYFYANLSKNLTLEDISDEFNLSKSYLNALFKKNTNTSPINYLISIKMKEACKLLRSTTYSIKIIAAELGYFDPYYFSHLFKKVVGISPSKYKSSDMIFF